MQEAGPRGLSAGLDPAAAGAEIHDLARRLMPIPRSLTGDGVRETLRVVGEYVPLSVTEVPTGTPIFDWAAPREWNVREAWIADSTGRRIVDWRESNLRLLGYSHPVRTRLTGAELDERLHSLPDRIPYRTAYWADTWGFCVTEEERRAIRPDEEYEVCIDARLEDGHLTYAEALLPGESEEEVLLSTYVCHPSLANDNVSGIALLAALGAHLVERRLHRTHRLLFSPGTLGPLAWLSRNLERLDRIRAGMVVACVGDPGPLRYKRSRAGDAAVDRAAAYVLRGRPGSMVDDFVPWGGDERQFCSPGFDLAVGSLSRSPHGAYPEYHTSADNLDVISGGQLAGSVRAAARILDVLDRERLLVGTSTRGEPQLGRRGLYGSIGTGLPADDERRALLWLLNLADGRHTLQDVAERSGLPLDLLEQAAGALRNVGLLEDD